MKRIPILSAVMLAIIAIFGVLGALRASAPQLPSDTWTVTGDMASGRAGASGTLLPDGRLLVAGGLSIDGATATAERYSVESGAFLATPPMQSARANHSATLLLDGRVLVVGGSGVDGHALNSAEIYDGAANAWLPAGSLSTARSGHSATLLPDGRVLVAGGDDAGVPSDTLEIFDPASGVFTGVDATMSTVRTGHAAAVAGSAVMLIGGFDGTHALASVDVFDSKTNAISAGPSLAIARAGHSATTLLDGKVLVAGGASDSAELASAEVFDPAVNAFAPAGGSLAVARQHHLAVLLPHNNTVLFLGGAAAGRAVSAAELYIPWEAGGSFVAAAAPSQARTWAAGGALSFPASDTVRSGPADGLLVLAGGSATADAAGPLKSAELYGFATIKTDKSDYAPGTTVTITGSGWQPGEWVALMLVESPALDTHPLLAVQADDSGNIVSTEFSPDEHDVNIRFYLTAIGTYSQAQTTFTDANLNGATLSVRKSDCTTASTSFVTGDTVCVHSTVSTGGGGTAPDYFVEWVNPSNVLAFTDTHFSVSNGQQLDDSHAISIPGIWTINACKNTGCSGGNLITSTTFTVVAPTATTTTVASSSNPSVFGQSVTFTAHVAPNSGTSTPTGSVQFSIDGSPVGGSVTLNSSGNAALSTSTLSVAGSPHTVSAVYTPTGSFVTSTGSLTGGQAINKAHPALSTTGGTFTYDGNPHPSVGTALGVDGTTPVSGSFTYTYTPPGDHTAPTNASATAYTVSAAFTSSDTNYDNGTPATNTITIGQATATVTVTPYSVMYDGHAHTASVVLITGVNGETGATVGTVDVTNTAHTNAGTYASDSWSFTGTANYKNISATTITDQISQATATVVVTPYSVTYDGHAHTATITSITGVNGEMGATVGSVDVSHTTHTNAGTYATDTWSFAGTANYHNIAPTTIIDQIDQATATVVVTPYSVTYDGHAHTATITSITGVNGEMGATVGSVDVSNTTHTNASTYDHDSWTFTGTANYHNIAATTITDQIDQATATIVVTPYSATYDGHAHTATITSITGVNGESGATVGSVDLSNTTHTNAGTYATDSWSFSGTANYKNIAATAITDQIDQATATVVVTPYSVVYDGHPHTATVASITGVNGESGAAVGSVDVSNTTHTNAGTYATDTWSFTGTANYKNISATTITDLIDQANATVSVTPYHVTYDGHVHTATVASIAGVNGETGATVGSVDVSNTTHTNAGTYAADSWSFTGTANYKNISATTITDLIDQANATVSVTPYHVTYDGHVHTATVASIAGVNGEMGATVGTVDVSNTTHTNAGTYATDSWSFTGTANYKNIASTTIIDQIDQAVATVTVAPYDVPYDGHAHTATVASIAGVNGEMGATVGSVDVSNTTHTNAGTYATDSWSFTGTANYKNISLTTITDLIDQANAIVTVTPYHVTYDGHVHTATVASIAGVNGETGATVGSVDASNTTHTNAGLYATDTWSFAGTVNYHDIAATLITDEIDQATATVTVTPYSVTYDGHPHSANVASIAGVNGESGAAVGSVDVTNTAHTNAGTFATDTWSFTGTANYKNIASTTIIDQIDQAVATVTVAPYDVPYDGHAHTATVASIAGVNGETGATVGSVDVSNTTHTNAGSYATDSWSFTGTANYHNIAATTIVDQISLRPAIWTTNPAGKVYGFPDPSPLTTGSGSNFVDAVTATYSRTGGETAAGGPYHITAALSASAGVLGNYTITNGGAAFTISPRPTNTTIAASPSGLVPFGQPVTFTATVAGVPPFGVPTGSVSFLDGSTPIGSCNALALTLTGTATCTVSNLAFGSHTIVAVYSGDPNYIGSATPANLGVADVVICLCDNASTIPAKFHSQPIPAGSYVWFNNSFEVKHVGKSSAEHDDRDDQDEDDNNENEVWEAIATGNKTVTFRFDQQTISVPGMATALPVPNAIVTFDPSATQATTSFDAGTNTWVTVAPIPGKGLSGRVFASGFAWQVPTALQGGLNPVVWKARITSDTPGLMVRWTWGAATFSTLPADPNLFGVKAASGKTPTPYSNGDRAGTPELVKQYATDGGRGHGHNPAGWRSRSATTGQCGAGTWATFTQTEWSQKVDKNGKNIAAALLAANFSSSVIIGSTSAGNFSLTFSSVDAIQQFLPAGGKAGVLQKSDANPKNSRAGVFAGQVLALQLNVLLSSKNDLAGLFVVDGPLAGQSVQQVLDLANQVLGGNVAALPAGLTLDNLNDIVTNINEDFDGGAIDRGYLLPYVL